METHAYEIIQMWVWKNENNETERQGNMDTEPWKLGDMKTWRFRDMEMGKQRY